MTTSGKEAIPADLQLPFAFSYPKSVRIRLRDDRIEADSHIWEERENQWREFWRPRGKHTLEAGGKACVDGIE